MRRVTADQTKWWAQSLAETYSSTRDKQQPPEAANESKMSHDELNALCAEKVGGWKIGEQAPDHSSVYWKDGQWVYPCDLPQYCTDPAAVIELLEKEHYVTCGRCYQKGHNGFVLHLLPLVWYVDLGETDEDAGKEPFTGIAPTFEEAGVRALLKAHGCEVGE